MNKTHAGLITTLMLVGLLAAGCQDKSPDAPIATAPGDQEEVTLVSSAGANPPAELTAEDLVARAEETASLLASGAGDISWTTRLTINGGTIDVASVIAGDKAKWILTIGQGSRAPEVLSIVVRDDVWYVRERGVAPGKYRPFEAPLKLPNAYLLLLAGELKMLTADRGASILSIDQDIATVRMGLPADALAQTQANIDAMRDALERLGSHPSAESLGANITELEALCKNGTIVLVDVNTGIILKNETGVIAQEVTALSLTGDASEDFDIGDEEWEDMTNDPTLGDDLNNLIMISNSPMATPANAQQLKGAIDARLIDLDSNQMRRIPFLGAACLPGCFSKDRKKVYVSGTDFASGTLSIYEIDLSTGENRKVTTGDLPLGVAGNPTLSPDGTKLAMIVVRSSLRSQVCVVDLETGKADKIGQPLDTAFLSWLPDGDGLILVKRVSVARDLPSASSIARMDMDGTLTVLREGGSPVLVPAQKKILFEQDGHWKTCDLDGNNVELYAGGMEGCHFPAVSADGERIVWMSFTRGRLPQPVIQDFGQENVEKLHLGPGLWAVPGWR